MDTVERLNVILRLVYSQMHSGSVFRTKSETASDAAYKELLEQIARELDQFTFEIRTEIRRAGDTDHNIFQLKEAGNDSEVEALQATLDSYEEAIRGTANAHTRAMLKRQQSELQQAYERLLASHRAA